MNFSVPFEIIPVENSLHQVIHPVGNINPSTNGSSALVKGLHRFIPLINRDEHQCPCLNIFLCLLNECYFP